jgi:hypothetical protein
MPWPQDETVHQKTGVQDASRAKAARRRKGGGREQKATFVGGQHASESEEGVEGLGVGNGEDLRGGRKAEEEGGGKGKAAIRSDGICEPLYSLA